MDNNLKTYQKKDIVFYYKKYTGLQEPEKKIFNLLESKMKNWTLLDVGIGGGRTTEYLYNKVEKYVGIDYSEEMILSCRQRFNGLISPNNLIVADIKNINEFQNESFDCIVFSFNGIDYSSIQDRFKSFQEIYRLLKPNGYFIFSTHNIYNLKIICNNPIRKNLIEWIKGYYTKRKIKKINGDKLSQFHSSNYVKINDGAHNFLLETTYVNPNWQIQELSKIGFKTPSLFDTKSGKEIHKRPIEEDVNDAWIYYVCIK